MSLIHDPSLTPEEHRLRDLLSDVSERCWSAGWLADTEFEVWRLATEGGNWGRYAAADLMPELGQIMALAKQLDRWVVWREREDSDNEAVDLAEWRRRYSEWAAARA